MCIGIAHVHVLCFGMQQDQLVSGISEYTVVYNHDGSEGLHSHSWNQNLMSSTEVSMCELTGYYSLVVEKCYEQISSRNITCANSSGMYNIDVALDAESRHYVVCNIIMPIASSLLILILFNVYNYWYQSD